MADPSHQQRTVVGQLLHARGHVVEGARHRTIMLLAIGGAWLFIRIQNRPLVDLEHAALQVGRGMNNAAPDLQGRMLQIHQRAVLNTDKQPGAAYRQQQIHQGDFSPLFRYTLAIMLLAIGGAWLFIRIQNRPLRHPHPNIGRQPGLQPHHGGAFIDLHPHLSGAAKLSPLFRYTLAIMLLAIGGAWLFIRIQNRPLVDLESTSGRF
jgi:hypothetical protein